MGWAMRCFSGRGWDVRFGVGGFLALVMLVLGLTPGCGHAFDDPPVRAVRLSYLQGTVRVVRADGSGADPGQMNMPLTEGQRVTTDEDGQAEVEFEDGSLLRIPPQSSVVLLRLGISADGRFETRVALLKGLVYAGLRAAPRYSYRLDAGGDAVTPVTNAVIRVMLDQPPAEVAVLEGTAHVERVGGYQVDVGAGESMRGDAAGNGRYFLSQRVEHNSWDDWNEEREQAAANDLAARTAARNGYAGDQGYGWSDLDANGTWYDAGQGGPVWQPFDAGVSGFDPYGYGSWVYTTGPGYVWSSGYSWGWTPFRCGSWSYWGDFGWGWRPAGNCRSAGWGYGGPGHVGRGNRINLSSVPPGYKRPLPPVPGGPVRVHPIIAVGTGRPPAAVRGGAYQAREIAGQMALPLRVAGSSYTPRGGSAVGSSLRRDFPVNTATRQPVFGAVRVPVNRRGPDAASAGASAPGRTGAGRSAITSVQGAASVERRRDQTVRPSYPGVNGVAPEVSSPVGSVRVHPGYRTEGGVPRNETPASLNSVPQLPDTVSAPLNTVPAPLSTVPRLPSTEHSVPVLLPPGQRPLPPPAAPAAVRVLPSAPASGRSAPPPAPSPATTASPKK